MHYLITYKSAREEKEEEDMQTPEATVTPSLAVNMFKAKTVKLSLCLAKQYAMNTYGGVGI
jgi:hypothetical protein